MKRRKVKLARKANNNRKHLIKQKRLFKNSGKYDDSIVYYTGPMVVTTVIIPNPFFDIEARKAYLERTPVHESFKESE